MKIKTKSLTVTALFAVVIAVSAWIALPITPTVPFTLQTLAVALCAYTLGMKRGTVCTALYLIMGAVGLPVFSHFRGGFSVLISPTGGFLFGFLLVSLLCGIGKRRNTRLILGLCSILACHAVGTVWFAVSTGSNLLSALLVSSLPFLLKDILSVTAALFIADRVKKEIFV